MNKPSVTLITNKFDKKSIRDIVQQYKQWTTRSSSFSKKSFLESEKPYVEKLQPYRHHITTHKSNKLPNDRHWKLHLNVEPDDCQEVSKYLKENEYDHKFLMGGDVGDGKIFTVYIGSFQKAVDEARTIHKDLEHVLKQPEAKYNINFTEGVSGRFTNSGKNDEGFIAAGYNGHPHFNVRHSDKKEELIQKSFNILLNKYGDYFFNGEASEKYK